MLGSRLARRGHETDPDLDDDECQCVTDAIVVPLRYDEHRAKEDVRKKK